MPDLIRQSMERQGSMDARVKPAHDDFEDRRWQAKPPLHPAAMFEITAIDGGK